MLNALRGLDRAGKLPPGAAATALTDLDDLRVISYDHEPVRPRIWSLRENLTAYDAAYVALAELLPATLITTDLRLARSSGHEAAIDSPA